MGVMDAAKQIDRNYIPLRVQRRNLLFVVLDGAAIGLMSVGGAFISVFVIRLGASAFWVSLLSSVPSAIALVMTIPWSRFAERRTRPQVVFAWARFAVHFVYPLVALVPLCLRGALAAKAIVVIWSLSAFPSSLSGMMFTLVMGHAVPPERRAFLMSRRWIFMGIAKLIAMPLASQLIGGMDFPLGYQVIYGANFAIAFPALFCALRLRVPKRERAVPPGSSGPWRARFREGIVELAQAKRFTRFVSGRAILNLGLGLVSAVIPIYWVKNIHASDAWIGYFNAALSAAALIAYLPWTRVKHKLGTQWTLIASVTGYALYPALMSMARTPLAVLPVIVFHGLVGSGLNLSFFDALLDVCPPQKEERFVAINMTAVNLAGVVGPPIGAALLGVLDIRWVMAVGTLVALGGVSVFALGTQARGRVLNLLGRCSSGQVRGSATLTSRLRRWISSVQRR
jgi:hypothetical protein